MKMTNKMYSIVGLLVFAGMMSVTSSVSAIQEMGYGGDDPACTMYATPDTIESGGGTTLDWDVNEYVTKAYLHPKGSTSWMQEVPLDGSWWISGIVDSRDYTLTVENEEGLTADCDAHVTVEESEGEELTCEMYADPATILEGDGTNLVWSSTGNVVSAYLHPTGSEHSFAEVGPNGSWWISGITNSRSYSVTLTDADGNSVTCDAPITVEEVAVEEEAPSCEIHANPEMIGENGATTLIWHNSANTVKATIEHIGDVTPDTGWWWMNGIVDSRSYVMTVENASGQTATCVADIEVGEIST